MAFNWNEEKNEYLRKTRGISFERVVVAIEEGYLIDIIKHSNTEKYTSQIILIVEIDRYAICVPCVIENEKDYFMKTLFPSRKYTKKYKLEEKNE